VDTHRQPSALLTAARPSDPSGTAEADGHLLVFDDDRDVSAAAGQPDHPVERGPVPGDVEVVERDMPP
jgi:hypothetical protein